MKNVYWYYKFLIVLIFFFSMFFLLNRHISSFMNESFFKDVTVNIIRPISFLKEHSLINYPSIVKENRKLKRELLSRNVSYSSYENMVNEVDLLKEKMNLKSVYTGYKVIYSKTITRNKMYWYSSITIDKGSSDGIRKNQAVVTENGLIGLIKDTTKNSSIVKLITNDDLENRLSGMIKVGNGTVVGLIEGYDYPYLKVSLATNVNNVKVGDKFYSSGLYGISKNIYIGTVEKVEKDSYDLGDVLYVKPMQDMNDINYVAVLGN